MTRGMNGIVVVNVLVVPMILLFTSLIAFRAIEPEGLFGINGFQLQQLQSYKWVLSPFVYAALNFAFIQAVLIPLGSEIQEESTLKWGGFWGGIGLGSMLLIYHFALNSRMPEMLGYDIPMAEIVQDLGPFLHVLFLLVLYGYLRP